MKHISMATAHCNVVELFSIQSFRLIGKYVRDYCGVNIVKDDEMLTTLRKLPNIIPGSFVGWVGGKENCTWTERVLNIIRFLCLFVKLVGL